MIKKNIFLVVLFILVAILFVFKINYSDERYQDNVDQIIPQNVINIKDAFHLDGNRFFISNIYDETKNLDGNWSETILGGNYIRVVFEMNLTSANDITLFPKISNPTNISDIIIEVYEKDSNIPIAIFSNLSEESYNKIFLTSLVNSQDTFDLLIKNGNVEIDHIIDPTVSLGSQMGDVALAPLEDEKFVIVYMNNSRNSVEFIIKLTNGTTLFGPIIVANGTGPGYNNTNLNFSRVAVASVNSTSFVVGWTNRTGEWRAGFNNTGGYYFSPTTTDGSIGTSAHDVSITVVNSTLAAYCYTDFTEGDADMVRFNPRTGAIIGSEIDVNAASIPETNLSNIFDCVAVNSTRIAAFDYDAGTDDDATYHLVNQTGGEVQTDLDIDTAVGASAQVATAAIDNNVYVLAWYDQADQDITISINRTTGTSLRVVTDIDTAAGTASIIALATVRNTSTNLDNFVVVYYNQTGTDIVARFYNGSGTALRAPIVVESNPSTVPMLMSAVGRNPATGMSLCNETWVVAYTNATNRSVIKSYWLNGSEWDGRCSETIPPLITINSPSNNSLFNTSVVELNYTVSVSNLASCLYTNSSGLFNYSLTCGNNISSSWSEGVNNITVYAIDSFNNINMSSVRFTVDTISPQITINHPANDTLDLPILFNITLDENASFANYTLNNGLLNYTMQNNENIDFNATNTSIADGQYTVIFFVWDTFGNFNSTTSRTFIVSNSFDSFYVNVSANIDLKSNNDDKEGLFKNPGQGISLGDKNARTSGFLKFNYGLFSLSSSNSKTRGLFRITSGQITISGIANRFSQLFRFNSDIISFFDSLFKFRSVSRSQSDSLTISSPIMRIFNSLRQQNERISFYSANNEFALFGRAQSQNINFNSITSRTSGLFRLPLQLVTLDVVGLRKIGLFRPIAQPLDLEIIGERVNSFVTYLVNVFQHFVIQPIADSISYIFKRPTDLYSINSGANKFRGINRVSINEFSLSATVSRLGSLFRLPLTLINLDEAISKNSRFARVNNQVISLSATTYRFANLFKNPSQLFFFSSSESSYYRTSRNTIQTVTLSNVAFRTAGLFRLPNQLLNMLLGQADKGAFQREPTQLSSLSETFSRFGGLFRIQNDRLSLGLSEQDALSAFRRNTQTISFAATTSRFIGLIKAPNQLVSFLTFQGRTLSLGRRSSERIGFIGLTERIGGFFRIQNSIIDVEPVSYYTFGVIRKTTQSISFTATTLRTARLFRLPGQMVSFELVALRTGGLARYLINVADQFNTFTIANRLYYVLKSFSTAMQFLTNLLAQMASGITGGTTGGSSGGGGSGGGSGSTIVGNIQVSASPSRINVAIKQGELVTKEFTFTNTGKASTKIALSSEDLDSFLRFDAESFDLSPGETKIIKIIFFAQEDIIPDTYIGKININNGGLTSEILVAIEVSSKDPLFDLKITVLEKFLAVFAGNDILAELNIFSLGRTGRVDVLLEYSIKDVNDKVILETSETLAIDTQLSIVKTIKIPKDLEPGDYLLSVRAIYGDNGEESLAVSSSWFRIQDSSAFYKYVGILVFILVAILVVLYLLRIDILKNRRWHLFTTDYY